MCSMSTLSNQIETDAAKAKKLKSGDFEKENRPLAELIEADRYLAEQAAVTAANRRGVILTKLRPPGSI